MRVKPSLSLSIIICWANPIASICMKKEKKVECVDTKEREEERIVEREKKSRIESDWG